MGKKADPLERGFIKREPAPGLIKRAMAEGTQTREFEEKLTLLFKKFKVAERNWQHLAIAMAVAYVPGFQLVKPPGRKKGNPPIWTARLDKHLLGEVSRLKRKRPSQSMRKICEQLAETTSFKGLSAEGLRRRHRVLVASSAGA